MQLSQRTLLHRTETGGKEKGYHTMSSSKKKTSDAAPCAGGEPGACAPAGKKDRKIRPVGLLAILREADPDHLSVPAPCEPSLLSSVNQRLQVVKDGLTEADLNEAIAALPFGNYILRRYYDRPLVKAEVKRSSIKIG